MMKTDKEYDEASAEIEMLRLEWDKMFAEKEGLVCAVVELSMVILDKDREIVILEQDLKDLKSE